MKYTGKLYGKIGKTYVEMQFSTDDVDALQAENERLRTAMEQALREIGEEWPVFAALTLKNALNRK